jgi:hypothetical protein
MGVDGGARVHQKREEEDDDHGDRDGQTACSTRSCPQQIDGTTASPAAIVDASNDEAASAPALHDVDPTSAATKTPPAAPTYRAADSRYQKRLRPLPVNQASRGGLTQRDRPSAAECHPSFSFRPTPRSPRTPGRSIQRRAPSGRSVPLGRSSRRIRGRSADARRPSPKFGVRAEHQAMRASPLTAMPSIAAGIAGTEGRALTCAI